MVEVVRDIGGLQAQLLVAAELALSARVRDLVERDVREALWSARSLVRAWTVRGTIHIVPADDLPLWTAALGVTRFWESRAWLERYELTSREAGAIFERVRDVLDDRSLTREEVANAVVEKLGARYRAKVASLWGDLLAPLTYMGKLCFGPNRGANVTFVRADRWIHAWREVAPDEAWTALLRRYLWAYGPATTADAARWFGVDSEHVLTRLRALGDAAVTTERGWVLRDDRRDVGRRASASTVRLLPQYDAYVMGCRPREAIVPVAVRDRIRTFKRGRWEGAAGVPVLLVDGVIAGVWDRLTRGGRVIVDVEPVLPLTAAQRAALSREAERVGRFFGRDAELSVR
jgi:hypothetical protein